MDTDAKFISEQFYAQYGNDAVNILEKMADIYQAESVARQNKAVKYRNAANILKLRS